ncbi:MAG: transporter substrate-binding domain-containing protein [Alphaproteobacteria bacterium]
MLKALLALALILAMPFSAHAEDKAFERINKNQEINCGVYVLGTIFSYDASGQPQGFTVDLFKEVSERTGLKVRYTEISSFATLLQDLNGGKYDMTCAPLLLLPSTAMKYLPGYFIGSDEINIYADGEKDISGIKTLADLNDPKYTFVGMDGELGGIYVPKMFPKAKLNLLAMGLSVSNMFLELRGKKADFVVLSRIAANAYLKDNPGQLKKAGDGSILKVSVRVFYPPESYKLKANIDAIIDEIQRDGTMDKLLKKHGLNFD